MSCIGYTLYLCECELTLFSFGYNIIKQKNVVTIFNEKETKLYQSNERYRIEKKLHLVWIDVDTIYNGHIMVKLTESVTTLNNKKLKIHKDILKRKNQKRLRF